MLSISPSWSMIAVSRRNIRESLEESITGGIEASQAEVDLEGPVENILVEDLERLEVLLE